MVIPPLSAALPGFTLLTSDNSYDIDYQDNLFEHQMVKKIVGGTPWFHSAHLLLSFENYYRDDDEFCNEDQDHDHGMA